MLAAFFLAHIFQSPTLSLITGCLQSSTSQTMSIFFSWAMSSLIQIFGQVFGCKLPNNVI